MWPDSERLGAALTVYPAIAILSSTAPAPATSTSRLLCVLLHTAPTFVDHPWCICLPQGTMQQVLVTVRSSLELINSYKDVSWFWSAFGSTSPLTFEAMHKAIDRDLQDLQVGVQLAVIKFSM